jgi:hypothetical protein
MCRFCLIPSLGMINRSVVGCQVEPKIAEGGLGSCGEAEVVNDPVHHRIVCQESDDLHRPAALGEEHGVDLVDLPDHGRPFLGGDGPRLFLDDQKLMTNFLRLADFPPMGISIQAVVAHHDLAFVWDVGGHPGSELQVVHPLLLFGSFPVPVTDLVLLLIDVKGRGKLIRSPNV